MLRNGVTLFATASGGQNGCVNFMVAQFFPPASEVSFNLVDLTGLPSVITLNRSGVSVTYTIPPRGSVPVTMQGQFSSINLTPQNGQFYGFGITGMLVIQTPLNNGIVLFDIPSSLPTGSNQTKVLLSKAAWDVGYPSTAQLAPDGAGNPRMDISGTLIDPFTGQPKSGTVYLRIDDPPDTAPYRGPDAHANDNDGPAAELSADGTTGMNVTVHADALGRFHATLTVKSRKGGDNYQVVGSVDPSFNCGTACPRSGVLTVWKRIYVEEQSMFKAGSFLTSGAVAGGTSFDIENPVPFQLLAPGAQIELIHADTFHGEGFYRDFLVFDSLQLNGNGTWTINIDPDPAHGGTKLPHSYGTAVATLPPYWWSAVLRDAVGIPSAGTYASDGVLVEPLFASAFVDVRPVTSIVPEAPYIESMDTTQDHGTAFFYAHRWFEHVEPNQPHHARPNVFHRIAARAAKPIPPPEGWGVELGVTSVGSGINASFVFAQRIDGLSTGPEVSKTGVVMGAEYTGTNPIPVNERTTAHETVHFWVNKQRPGTDKQGHCSQVQYDNASLTCLLHRPSGSKGLDSLAARLHYIHVGPDVDSEYLLIRKADDPVPQD